MLSDEIFFQWSPDCNVGINAIDDQHRVLVNTLNRLCVAVSKHEGDKVITGVFDALISYTRIHFTLEERLMRHAKHEYLDAHIKEHKKLVEQLNQLYKKHLLEDDPIYYDLMEFLKSWLIEHIQGMDKQFGVYLQQTGLSVDEWEREAIAEFKLVPNNKIR